MKRTTKAIIIALLILIASNAFSQTKKEVPLITKENGLTASKVDSLTQTTKFISIADLYRIIEPFKDKATYNQFNTFLQLLQATLNELVQEYYNQQKQLPKK